MAWVENGKWRGQAGNNKYKDSTYHAVFEINRNPIETVSHSIFKTDSSPTLSAVKGEDFTWQGNCDIEISYYNSDKTICDSAPAAAGDYYVKVSTPTIEADEDGNTVRYEASESDYIPFTIVHNFPDTFDSNGFKNCLKCNATVYQPATETNDKYDIDDDGTKEAVYEISNAGQLYWFAGLVNGTLDGVEQNTLANAILTANITVNENLLDSLQYDAKNNVSNGSDFISWTPIADWMGNHTTQYSGTFDGNNKTVSGLYFNGDSTCIGLFGSSESDGNIKNVGVVDSYFKGNDSVGGVCGNNAGTITNCYNAGNLTAIESSAHIGGICGYNNSGTIANCYNTGTVTANGQVFSVGGVCGCSTAPISNCYNIGTVTATSSDTNISGICGYYFGSIKNCYYLANTEDENGGKTADQFASGEVAYLLNGDQSDIHFYQTIGDDAFPTFDNTHGVVYSYAGCTDKTYYTNTETADIPHDFDENGFCKKNSTHYQPATLNSETGNYEIENAGQLYWFAAKVNAGETSANAILTADIVVNEGDLSGYDGISENSWRKWTPINSYSGTFDGQNHKISGLYFNDDNRVFIGLFETTEGATIKKVGVVNSYFEGSENVGGICGVGFGGTISECYSTATVIGINVAGGICGIFDSLNVINCFNSGKISARSEVGGICGSIRNSSVENCYYDKTVFTGDAIGNTSDTNTIEKVEGKTTEQFASGEVAYLLSQGCTVGEGEDAVTYSGSVWGQNLATENYPVLNGKTVYQVDSYEGCIGNPGNSTKVYSNTNAPIYVEHNYSSKGTCTICGAFKNGIGEHLDGYSLSLDGNIGVNFFMELDKSVIADENAYMKFRLPNGKTSVVLVGDAKQQTVSGTTYYVFSCEVAAKEMNETITAQIITSDKKGEVYEYSVADYIQYIRDNPTEFDEKTLSLVNAMAGYGDYAKAYFNNENLDANTEMDAVTADTLASFDKQISGDLPEGITYYGSSLLLESNTTMRHYFKVAEGTDVSALSFSGSKSNYYYIDIPNISAEKLGTIQNVTIGNCTISYSPMSYAYAVLSSKNTSESLKNLVKSLYLYEQAAEAYKN